MGDFGTLTAQPGDLMKMGLRLRSDVRVDVSGSHIMKIFQRQQEQPPKGQKPPAVICLEDRRLAPPVRVFPQRPRGVHPEGRYEGKRQEWTENRNLS